MSVEIGDLQSLTLKPGDLVECVEARTDRFRVGKQYYMTERGLSCEADVPQRQTTSRFRVVKRSQVPTGPVRTVTRKEIVPGLYGAVVVVGVGDGDVMRATRLTVSCEMFADQIRAAIATLTEIADAIEAPTQ